MDSRFGFTGVTLKTVKENRILMTESTICLDSGSTLNAVREAGLCRNLQESDKPIIMQTNAGDKELTTVGELPGLKSEVWIDPTCKVNVLSLSGLTDQYRVTFDSSVDDAFIVHNKNNMTRFGRTQEGFYGRNFEKKQINAVQQVDENMEGFSRNEVEKAKQARKLYHMVGAPTIENFKMMITGNMIKNCPMSVADVEVSKKIWGKDISRLKGTTVRKTPRAVVDMTVDIPDELREKISDIHLHMDVMWINGHRFLTTIGHLVYYRTCSYIESTSAKELYCALDKVMKTYNAAGYRVKTIKCDREFQRIMEDIKEQMEVTMVYNNKFTREGKINISNAGDHFPAAERNNRTIKEAFRTGLLRSRYKRIPKTMIIELAEISADRLNWFL